MCNNDAHTRKPGSCELWRLAFGPVSRAAAPSVRDALIGTADVKGLRFTAGSNDHPPHAAVKQPRRSGFEPLHDSPAYNHLGHKRRGAGARHGARPLPVAAQRDVNAVTFPAAGGGVAEPNEANRE